MKRYGTCLALALALAGCSLPFGRATPSVPLEVRASNEHTRTIRHTFGDVAFPIAPERVLSLGEDAMLIDLLSIGITPVAANVNLPEQVPLLTTQELDGVALLSSSGDTSIEQLAAYRPDAIIGTNFFIQEIGYETLSRIAPTVATGGEGLTAQYRETLAAFGRAEQAAATIAAFNDRVHADGQRLAAQGRSVSVGTVYPGPSVAAWVAGPLPPPQLLVDLGFTLSPGSADIEGLEARGGRAFISLEQLELFGADTLILLQSSAVEGEAEALAAIKAEPLWAQLPAVAADRVFTLDRLGYPGFRGLEQLLSDLVAIVEQ